MSQALTADALRPGGSGVAPGGGVGWAVRDTSAMAGRNLRRLMRQPEMVMFNIVSPIMFVLLLTGYAVGFRPASFLGLILGALLLLLFALAVSLGYAIIGLLVRTPEAVNAATFPIIFPLTFASSAFVPVQTMPSWLRGFATHQPVSVVINAARSLILGDSATAVQRAQLLGGTSTGSLIVQALAWSIGIGLVFGLLCARRYRRLTR